MFSVFVTDFDHMTRIIKLVCLLIFFDLFLQVDVRQKCQTLDAEGETFAELISCCRSLIDIQSHKLHNIDIFMKQYGYNDFKPKGMIFKK